MVMLDDGFFSSFDCGQRMGAIFLATFLAQILIVTSLATSARRASPSSSVIEVIDRQPFFTRRRLVTCIIWSTIFAVVSGVCTFLRTTTAVFLDSTSVVETSCNGPFPSEFRLDRAKSRFTFDHDPTWLTKRPLASSYLMITQADKPRPIFIHLAGRPASKELIELAPEAMAEYSRYRSTPGIR